MSEELGPTWYGVRESHPFLGREIGEPREYAEATAARLDTAVSALMEKAHLQAQEVLAKHRSALDALANELLLHETVDGQQLDAVLAAQGSASPDGEVTKPSASGQR